MSELALLVILLVVFALGGLFGVLLTACVVVGKKSDDDMRDILKKNEKGE